MARLSILIPSYNVENYLPKTIDSVLCQSFTDWELLILDDCSTDNSYSIACEYELKYPKIKAIKNERNLGMLENWNKGISLCHSEFFIKLDADDIWHPTMLEKSVALLDSHKDVALIFTRFININEKGEIINGTDEPLPDFVKGKEFDCIELVRMGPDKMLSFPILRQGLSLMRRAIFDKIGTYKFLLSKETQASTDTEFYFRIGAHYKILYIDEVLYFYRLHQSSISSLDKKNFLSDLKMYEIKKCILQYYVNQHLLTEEQENNFLQMVEDGYVFSKIARYKTEKKYFLMLLLLLTQLIKKPDKFLSFYSKRISEKINKK